jgi:hypothetical protein
MPHIEAATCPRDRAPPGFATAAAVVCRESGAGRLLALADEALRTIPPRTSCGRVKQMHWCTEAGGLRGDGARCAEVMKLE